MTKQQIQIDAVIKTSLEGIDKNVKELQSKLKEGSLQIDLTKGMGKDISKLIGKFEDGFSKIKQMTPNNMLDLGDASDFQKESEKITKTITEIQRIVGDLGTKNIIDAKKLFPNSFDERVSQLADRIKSVEGAFEQIGKKEASISKITTEISSLSAKLEEVKTAAANLDVLKSDFEQAATSAKNAEEIVDTLRQSLAEEIRVKLSQENIETTKKEISELQEKMQQIESKGITKGAGGKGQLQGKNIGAWKESVKNGTAEEKEAAKKAIEILQEYNNINTTLKERIQHLEKINKLQNISEKSPDLSDDKAFKEAGKALGKKDDVSGALSAQAQAIQTLTTAQEKYNQAQNAQQISGDLENQIAQKTQKITQLSQEIKALNNNANLSNISERFKEITGLDLDPTKDSLAQMQEALSKTDTEAYDKLKEDLKELGITSLDTKDKVEEFKDGIDKAEKEVKELNDAQKSLENMKQKIRSFFEIGNTVELFKRAIKSAMQTVKELDKTMTEAAVVTDFSVGDMWDKLPEYSSNAQQLGVSINGMYQATTLYYQQGLRTNEAMALGVETMKMGKIAAMDSTEATKAMTAALRGFNMELNETSATRVNDVYSQLAAVTAADTNQIATAMEKTASIAASANMEFETTAALLAQIIETTQEAPETAGTAMKTIIARFSEVKKLQGSGQTIGVDAEGEGIDVNKIQAALRSVGISMDGFFEGSEGLDSVLLKLAEKWGTLDFETQRYIATMAAGSRQQSRFIAMMSDYKRTSELVGEAQSSAGASQEQFNKTLESMESKLQKLENAWNEFLMGISNNEILKIGIDILTGILETINKITESISGGNGLLKSLTSLVMIIAALKVGKGLFKSFDFDKIKNKFSGKKPEDQTQTPPKEGEQQPANPEGIQQGQDPSTKGQSDGETYAQNYQDSVNKTTITVKKEDPAAQGQQDGKKYSEEFNQGADQNPNKKTVNLNRDKNFRGQGKINTRKSMGAQGLDKNIKLTGKNAEVAGKKLDGMNDEVQQIDKTAKGAERSVEGTGKTIEDFGDKTQTATDGTNKLSGGMTEMGDGAKAAAPALTKAGKAAQQSGNQMKESGDKAAQGSVGMDQMTQKSKKVGGAMMGIGLAAGLLGQLFESMGMDKTAEAFSTLSAILVGVGSAIVVLAPLATMLGKKFQIAGLKAMSGWIWLAGIILAVTLLIWGVTALIEHIEENSIEGQMKAAAEATEAAKEAAEKAKQAYEELLEGHSEHEELQKKLEGLTRGTEEWTKALIEANNKVMELITTYPILARYLETGAYGQLTINNEGWEQAEKQANKRQKSTGAYVQVTSARETELKYIAAHQKATEKIFSKEDSWIDNNSLLGIKKSHNEAVRNSNDLYYIIEAWKDTPEIFVDESNEKLEELAKQVGLTAEQLVEASDEIAKIALENENTYSAMTAQKKAALTAVASDELVAYEYGDALLTGAAKNYNTETGLMNINYADGDPLQGYQGMNGGDSDDIEDQEITKEIAKEYGLAEEDFSGDDLEMAQRLYMKANGLEKVEDIPDIIKENEERLVQEVARKYALDQSIKKVEKVQRNMENLDEETQRKYATILSGEANMAYLRDRGELIGDNGVDLDTMATDLGFESEEELLEYFGLTEDELQEKIKKLNTDIDKEFNKIFSDRNASGFGDQLKEDFKNLNTVLIDLGISEGLTIAQSKALANSLGQVAANGGNANEILEKIPMLLAGISQANLPSALALITSTDWNSQESIKNTINALRELGANLDNKVIYELYRLSNAAADFSIDSIEKELEKLQKIIDSIEAKAEEGNNVFTREERDQLLNQGFGQGQFVRIGFDEFVFMGETNNLLKSINDYVAEMLGEMRTDLDDQIEEGEIVEDFIEVNGKSTEHGATYQYVEDGEVKTKDITTKELLEKIHNGEIIYDDETETENDEETTEESSSGVDISNIAKQIVGGVFGEEAGEAVSNVIEALPTTDEINSLTNEIVGSEGTEKKDEKNKGKSGVSMDKDDALTLLGQLDSEWQTRRGFTAEEVEKMDTAQILAIVDSYYQSYENLDPNRQTYNGLITQESSVGYAAVAGTQDLINNQNIQKIEEDRKKWQEVESEFVGINIQDFLRQNANGDINLQDENQRKLIQQIATKFDPSINLEETSIAELSEFLANEYNATFGITDTLDAIIKTEEGLAYAVEVAEEALVNQNGELKVSQVSLKNFCVGVRNTQKDVEKLSKSIEENIDLLKEGNKTEQGNAASAIASKASKVFGDQIDASFVMQHKQLFLDLAEGGEAAVAAWQELAKLSAAQWLQDNAEAIREFGKETEDGSKRLVYGVALLDDFINTVQMAEGLNAEVPVAITGLDIAQQDYATFIAACAAYGIKVQYDTEKQVWLGQKISASGFSTGKKSGGGSSKKWENPYDEFYNMVAKINEELRTREKLERRYQRLLDRNAATVAEIAELTDKQLQSYKTERLDRQTLLNGRIAQMESILEQFSDVGEYATYNWEGRQVEINWSLLEKLEGSTNEELTSRIEDYISKLEEQEEMIEEEEDALEDIEDAVWEIYNQGKDEYFDLEDRVKEAIIADRQKEIDKLSEINDSINDTNSKLLESMQKQIEEERKNRDNSKKENEISDKQRRLAYLSQDTSGANALEILNLQKEIDEAQQDYTDTLIDQKITELQDQNDRAAEQRERQIDIMNEQLEHYIESGEIWNQVHQLITEGVDAEKKLMPGSELTTLLQSADGYEGMSKLKKMDWLNELETSVATSLAWLESGAMQSLYGMGASVEFTDADGNLVKGTINKDGDVLTKDGRAYSAGSFKINPETGKITSSETTKQAKSNYETASKVTSNTPNVTNVYQNYGSGGSGGGYIPTEPPEDPPEGPGGKEQVTVVIGAGVSTKKDALGQIYYKTSKNTWVRGAAIKAGKGGNAELLPEKSGSRHSTYQLLGPIDTYSLGNVADRQWYPNGLQATLRMYDLDPATLTKITGSVYKYKTGGLADFTGPAWLDGTKSRPEYILNADQTKAFFNLVDVLGSLQLGTSKTAQNTGDNTYDIDINVESIGSDYDVEQLANTVKRLINEDARYRNNNTINLMR